MQHALFTLIKACIKQATLNSHLNLLSVSADIRPRRTTVGTRSTAVFRRLTTPSPHRLFRRILTGTEIAQQIVNARSGSGFLCSSLFAAAFCRQPLSRRQLSRRQLFSAAAFSAAAAFLRQLSRQQRLSSQPRQPLSSRLPEPLFRSFGFRFFLSISSGFFAASASAFF